MTSPEERFERIVAEARLPLLAYARRRVQDPADAADVVAETYLVAWRRLDDVPDGDSARSWLFGVARRVLANHHRGERRRLALADRLRATVVEVLPAPQVEEPALVVRALQQLSQGDQELLRLVAWEELTHEELALALGVSRPTVRVRLHRARRRLARVLDEMTETGEVVAAGVQRPRATGHEGGVRVPACTGAEEVQP